MKRLFTTLLASITLCATAQISEYQHPCSVVGQLEVAVDQNQPFSPSLESLIIHDIDDNVDNSFDMKLLKGENYEVVNGKIVPKSGFNGILTVNIQLNDGTSFSEPYGMKVQVGERKTDDSKIIYVAPNGNDSANGTINNPLKTLQGAKDMVRKNGAEIVYFREGEYFSGNSVRFESEDSGSEQAPIIYSAYPGEKVRFTGSVKLPYEEFKTPKAQQIEAIDNVYIKAMIRVIDLKRLGITEYGEIQRVGYGIKEKPIPAARLYIDGAAMHIARYPNVANFNDVVYEDLDSASTNDIGDTKETDTKENMTTYKSLTGVMFNWKQKEDIWVDGSMSKAWEWQKNKIATIAPDSTIVLEWECHSKIGAQAVKMFYFNVFEELDVPEEYYMDKKNGLLYAFLPSTTSAKSDIRFTQSDKSIIELDGVQHIAFKNIMFEGTRNSAINTLSESSYNKFENCEIRSCGLEGIVLNGYANRVKNCIVSHVGANGISMTGGDVATITPSGNIIENTKVHDFAQERRAYNSGLEIRGVGQIAHHIELYNGPHMAVRMSGVNHIIEYSDFHDAPREYSDMLGIYLCTGGDLLSRGTIIRRNKFHDVNGSWKQSGGVYLDNETNGVVVEENFFYDNIAQERGWAVMVHGGADNMVRRNVFVNCSYPFCVSTRLNGYAKAMFPGVLQKWGEQSDRLNKKWIATYPEMAHIFVDGGKKAKPNGPFKFKLKYDKNGEITNYWNLRTPSSNVFEGNLVYNSDPNTFALQKSTLADEENNSYVNRGYYSVMNFRSQDGVMQECLIHSNNHNATSDPGFFDHEGRNLQVKAGSEITKDLPHLADDYFQRIGIEDKNSIGVQ